ncbi:MAG: LysM peptidoglycan-binding domain-containing protein, partial [Chloroflexota bacterium]|nr:LysM peptidoglycan-binding domain-containing protein [Chloroflexota bacterium]
GGSVCVFLRSKTKWAYQYLDAYWDDASLVMTSPGTPPTDTPPPPPPTSPPPTAGPSPTPRPAPTPRPDGAIVHIVESGDTLFGIALMYGVEVAQLRQLNAGSLGPNDLISVGQAIVISIPSEAPTPSPLPAPPTTEPTPGSPEEEATTGASICVLAYHDRNGDTFRDEATEELLPNAEFAIANASGIVDRYTSNGVNEPHCFTGLTPGAYRVIQTAPAGYAPSGPAEYNVGLPEDTSLDFHFGDARSENPDDPDEAVEPTQEGEEPAEPEDETTASRIFSTVAKISGILVLLLAGGVAVLFFLNRRRM